jgi:integrase
MATVGIQPKKLKSGKRSYALWYKDPSTGKQRHYKTYRLKKVADEELMKLRILIDTGSVPEASIRKKRGVITLSEIGDMLRRDWRNKVRTGEMVRKTEEGYTLQLQSIEKVFGERLFGSITKDEILDYRIEVAETFSNVSSNRRFFIFKQLYAKAKEKGYIGQDEISGVRYLSEKKHERTFWLRPEQLSMLLDAARQNRSKHHMVLAILLAAEHGASRQEILSLKWNDIDFELAGNGCINFHRTKNGVRRIHRLDMGRTRNALLERRRYLAERRDIAEDKVEGYVVGHVDGSPMIRFKASWDTIKRKAGFEKMHFHDLRHTFCTNLVCSGMTLKQVKELIGHRTMEMTERYAHFEQLQDFGGLRELANRYEHGESQARSGV